MRPEAVVVCTWGLFGPPVVCCGLFWVGVSVVIGSSRLFTVRLQFAFDFSTCLEWPDCRLLGGCPLGFPLVLLLCDVLLVVLFSGLVSRVECGVRWYWFLIIAFSCSFCIPFRQ